LRQESAETGQDGRGDQNVTHDATLNVILGGQFHHLRHHTATKPPARKLPFSRKG
jgi:hypothetical protein